MSVPEMPWYAAMEDALTPLSPYSSFVLIILAIATMWVAFRADPVVKMAFLVYLISP